MRDARPNRIQNKQTSKQSDIDTNKQKNIESLQYNTTLILSDIKMIIELKIIKLNSLSKSKKNILYWKNVQ